LPRVLPLLKVRCGRGRLAHSWTKKHGKSYFGYKFSAHVDREYKLIRHDSQYFEAVFDPGSTSGDVYADRGLT